MRRAPGLAEAAAAGRGAEALAGARRHAGVAWFGGEQPGQDDSNSRVVRLVGDLDGVGGASPSGLVPLFLSPA